MSFLELVAAADQAVRDHLGGVVVIYTSLVATVEVVGMFEEQYVLVDSGNGDVENLGPAVWLRLADLPLHPDDDEPVLTILGKSYRVRERKPDGVGSIRLLLHRTT